MGVFLFNFKLKNSWKLFLIDLVSPCLHSKSAFSLEILTLVCFLLVSLPSCSCSFIPFACLLFFFVCLFIVVFCLLVYWGFFVCLLSFVCLFVVCLLIVFVCFFIGFFFVCLFVEEAVNGCSEKYADLGASQLKVISSPHPIIQMAGPGDEAYCWFQAQASPGIACVTLQL